MLSDYWQRTPTGLHDDPTTAGQPGAETETASSRKDFRLPKRPVLRRILLAAGILGVIVIGTIQVAPGSSAPASTNTPGNTMGDPEAYRVVLTAQLDAAQQLIGGEWSDPEDRLPKVCSVDGVEGFTFTDIRRSNVSTDESVRGAVAALWDKEGFEITRQDTVDPYDLLTASSPEDPSNVLRFGFSEKRMYLFGQGACGEGDAYQWYSENGDQ
ncbi:MAG: hypothetical protein JWQ43_4035 [Glaciihabitans sp.]|nr:hypothetical protein [Glaciihabitans sp.]